MSWYGSGQQHGGGKPLIALWKNTLFKADTIAQNQWILMPFFLPREEKD